MHNDYGAQNAFNLLNTFCPQPGGRSGLVKELKKKKMKMLKRYQERNVCYNPFYSGFKTNHQYNLCFILRGLSTYMWITEDSFCFLQK